jgi:hypothetical protein
MICWCRGHGDGRCTVNHHLHRKSYGATSALNAYASTTWQLKLFISMTQFAQVALSMRCPHAIRTLPVLCTSSIQWQFKAAVHMCRALSTVSGW